jgi:SHAQKYF class myb-like DNA-binding protein
VPWTEEEHNMFLRGLEKLGKGNWRGISRDFVTTRTPTQVASHAQKHFLRRSQNSFINKRKHLSLLKVIKLKYLSIYKNVNIPIHILFGYTSGHC